MGATVKLRCQPVAEVPLAEVSALAIRPVVDSPAELLLAAGDRSADLVTAVLPRPGGWSAVSWEVVHLGALPAPTDPGVAADWARIADAGQIEALAGAGTDQLVVLRENPNVAALIVGWAPSRVLQLNVDPRGPAGRLAGSWEDQSGSHGEGVVLLGNGHLLVAKEKDPLALVEFGPAGESAAGFGAGLWVVGSWPVPATAGFEALACWDLDAPVGDLSDATVSAEGTLLLLSDQDEAIYEVAAGAPGDRTVALTASYRLKGVKGKPEGLATMRDGSLLVAADDRPGRENLYWIPPGWRG